jgi:hypothetical protein
MPRQCSQRPVTRATESFPRSSSLLYAAIFDGFTAFKIQFFTLRLEVQTEGKSKSILKASGVMKDLFFPLNSYTLHTNLYII